MPKHRREALEKFFRDAGARTPRERRELAEKLGWVVRLRTDEFELLKSKSGGEQLLLPRQEISVKKELGTKLDSVILDAESRSEERADDRSEQLPVDPAAKQGGEHGA